MLSARNYSILARVAAIVLGAGSLSWSASNPDRVRLMFGECSVAYTMRRTEDVPTCGNTIRWSGCETLGRELGTAAFLLILGGLPAKPAERG